MLQQLDIFRRVRVIDTNASHPLTSLTPIAETPAITGQAVVRSWFHLQRSVLQLNFLHDLSDPLDPIRHAFVEFIFMSGDTEGVVALFSCALGDDRGLLDLFAELVLSHRAQVVVRSQTFGDQYTPLDPPKLTALTDVLSRGVESGR